MFAIFMLLIYGTGSYALLAFLLFVVGFCCAYQILAIYTASTYVRERVAGLTTAVANMIIMSFGYVFHSSIGGLVKSFGSKGQAVAYTYGISMIPAALFIASLGFFGMYMRVRIASQK